MCECPWSIRGNICKHAIKVNWLYFHLGNSKSLFGQDAMANTLNDSPEISIESQIRDENIDMTLMPIDTIDVDAEALHMAREELLRNMEFFKSNPPTSLIKINKLNSFLNNFWDHDFDFTPSLGALDSSLKRKKSFLSPTKKQMSKKNNGLGIDLNVHPSEYEPFEFQYLNR